MVAKFVFLFKTGSHYFKVVVDSLVFSKLSSTIVRAELRRATSLVFASMFVYCFLNVVDNGNYYIFFLSIFIEYILLK